MKALWALLGVGAACGACCALPLLVPLLGGLVASGTAGLVAGWPVALGVAVLGGAIALGWYVRQRKRACVVDPRVGMAGRRGCGATSTSRRCGRAR